MIHDSSGLHRRQSLPYPVLLLRRKRRHVRDRLEDVVARGKRLEFLRQVRAVPSKYANHVATLRVGVRSYNDCARCAAMVPGLSSSMLTQRNAIVAAMKERGWHLAEVDDSASEWWWDERLAFESRWTPVGAKVFLTFLVDPQCDGPRTKGEAVWAVVASAEPPEQRPTGRDGIWLTVGVGWQDRLADFVQQLDALRSADTQAGSDSTTVTLYRPVGQNELDLIAASGYRRFPPRLPEQPIFYPVCNEEYAIEIAERWNARDNGIGHVTRFRVLTDYLRGFEPQVVGARHHAEYWIPAEQLDAFNDAIVGPIEVIRAFRRSKT